MSHIKRELDKRVFREPDRPHRNNPRKPNHKLCKPPTITIRGNALEQDEAVAKLGISYQEYLQSRHWKRTRAVVVRAYDKKCAQCESKKEIQVHHLTYERLGDEKFTDLLPLCRVCHLRHHNSGRDDKVLSRYLKRGAFRRVKLLEEITHSRKLVGHLKNPLVKRKVLLSQEFLEEAGQIEEFFLKGGFPGYRQAMVAMGYRFTKKPVDARKEHKKAKRPGKTHVVSRKKRRKERQEGIDTSFKNRALPTAP